MAFWSKLVTFSSAQLKQQCLFQHQRKTGFDRPGKMVIILQDGICLRSVEKTSTSGFLSLNTIDILDWIILFYGVLSSAL